MNHELISQICFAEIYVVPPHQTARSLFTRLPHGMAYADTLIECIATGYLIAVVESICIKEMQQHIDAEIEVVVGRSIRIEHRAPIPPGAAIRVSGWVEQVGRRSTMFCIRAFDDDELVCEGQVTLVAADRESIESRIVAKINGLQRSASSPQELGTS
ncbi:MAG: hotdog domain-containing protein [Rhodoferax sp.]|nr:hotdog domain-containing protein [Rhodoferax sp.]MDP3653802.1 hotdog domain-containing protein [Rhodoferax sp.]